MRDGRPSLTASLVAFGRAVGVNERTRDALAGPMLPAPLASVLGVFEAVPAARGFIRTSVRLASLGMVDHAALRMAAVDAAVRNALASGCDRVVIVGAGLDTRAWRMPELRELPVFEVDHPSTQARKRARIGSLPPRTRAVTFVAADLASAPLDVALERAGHLDDGPTLWLWEAVAAYLERPAIDSTLRAIAARSREDGWIAMTYVTPDLVPLGRMVRTAARFGFRVLGEPLVGAMSREAMAELLSRSGFEVMADTDSRDWASRFGGSAMLATPFRSERLVVARRRGSGV